jgi:hypothetical protein
MHPKGFVVPIIAETTSLMDFFRYVEMLLQQQEWLSSGLLKLYRRTQIGSDLSRGSPMKGKDRSISVHHILEQLGVMNDQNRIVFESAAATKFDQQKSSVSNDENERIPYSPDIETYDDRCGGVNSILSESFYHSPTTVASDNIPMLMSDDPCSAFFQFPNPVEKKSEPTIWIQDPDADLSVFPSWCRDTLISGDEGQFGDILASKMQICFESPVQNAVHSDLGSVFIKDITQTTKRTPLLPIKPVSGSRTSTTHSFVPEVAFASMQGDKGRPRERC